EGCAGVIGFARHSPPPVEHGSPNVLDNCIPSELIDKGVMGLDLPVQLQARGLVWSAIAFMWVTVWTAFRDYLKDRSIWSLQIRRSTSGTTTMSTRTVVLPTPTWNGHVNGAERSSAC